MLHEYTDLINELKKADVYFAALCKKYDELNENIDSKAAQASELDALKKEKLKLANCVLRAPKINSANTTIEIPATISPDCNSGTAFKVKIAVTPIGI